MIRFKVVKGSHLLLGIAVVVLLAVVLFIVLEPGSSNVNNHPANSEAKVAETFASANVRIKIIPEATSVPSIDRKSILIYHTHTHEAYEQDASEPYEAIETWRTADQQHSVVRVGAALCQTLEGYGFNVVHDTTDHELDSLSDSYVRSLETLKSYEERFDLYIDLHRDAYCEGMLPSFEFDGQEYAQVMLLVGRGDKHDPSVRPDYEENLAFAQKLTSSMNRKMDGFCRNVTVKQGRYNQHIGTPSILLEVGHNKNSLQHALNSVHAIAEAIAENI